MYWRNITNSSGLFADDSDTSSNHIAMLLSIFCIFKVESVGSCINLVFYDFGIQEHSAYVDGLIFCIPVAPSHWLPNQYVISSAASSSIYTGPLNLSYQCRPSPPPTTSPSASLLPVQPYLDIPGETFYPRNPMPMPLSYAETELPAVGLKTSAMRPKPVSTPYKSFFGLW